MAREPASTPPSRAAAAGPVGKVRSPVAVILLSIITIGIYALYWYYKTFQELKDHTGEGVGGVVGLILAIFINPVNWFLLPNEVGNVYERSGQQRPVSAITGLWNLIPLIGSIIWVVKVQGALNRYWESKGA
jgi:Domain of unknown function (DUF4234)